jgi:cation-transporting ATPase E
MKNSHIEKPEDKRNETKTPDLSQGLSFSEVEERKKEGKTNAANVKVQKSYLKIIVENTFTFFSIVLYFVAILFLLFRTFLISQGHEDLATAYFGISKYFYLGPLICSTVIGIFQECRSKRVLDKLKIVSDSKYTVIRGGKEIKVSSQEIVLQDIIKIEAGEQIPADISLLEGYLEVNESLLTGEADDVKKDPSEGKNSLLSGSSVVSGSAKGIVTAVGKETYANRLQQKVKNIVKNKSELMKNIYGIINFMSIFLFVIVIVVISTMAYKINKWGGDSSIFIAPSTKEFLMNNFKVTVPSSIGLSDLYSWSIIITTASAFAIGVIPMGLVLLTSVTLAVSVISLTKKQTLIQELYSLENLSRIDTICLDKTGTLTDGSMSVKDIIFTSKANEEKKDEIFKRIGAFLGGLPSNNATSLALVSFFKTNRDFPIKEVVPFSSTRKRSEVIFEDKEDYCLGAPEYILSEEDKQWQQKANEIASSGLRVLVFTINSKAALLISLQDNIRPSAPSTIDFFNQNGVDVKIISGDNPLTVSKIASQCHVIDSSKAVSLEGVKVEDLDGLIDQYVIFGRVSPEQKEALVIALQKKGKKVAMTGDGVNDILALRKANSSISFSNATDAAKSCSDVVLMDNDFSHLKDVVAQGRRVVNNIQRTSILFLMKTICISILAFLLIPFKKGQSEFTIENIYLIQTGVIAVAGFLLSVESCPSPIKGSFKDNVYPAAFASGILMALGAFIPCVLNAIIINGSPLISHDNTRSLISILTTLAGFTVLFRMCLKFTKYRVVVFSVALGITLFLVFALPTVYVGGRSWSLKDIIQNGAQSEISKNFFNLRGPIFTSLGFNEYMTMLGFTLLALPLYVFSMKQIDRFFLKKRTASLS